MTNLYQKAKRNVRGIAVAGLVGLAGAALVGCVPKIEKVSDMNGDSIPDVQLYIPASNERWVYLGNKDGSYLTLYQDKNGSFIALPKADGGAIYFMDAESGILRLSKQ